ncbi:MAG: SusD/RagB family nutrient-binding outer membrane lipoprotein [Tunicatimonas sp.]|uniref:SusD/RagB family nutrient-binding outer membrane lipoprotein n=1 Tax=Tunicatimonas sp. TaxID=1940096 RepID=UPI003C712310
MKNIKAYIVSLLIVLGLTTGCEEEFDKINTNETLATSLDPSYSMNDAIITASFPTSIFIYELAIVQQIITPNGSSLAGANFNQDNQTRSGIWQNHYRNVLKSTVDVLDKTQEDPEYFNLYQMARIWRAYTGMQLTDTFGDVPFSEAGLAFLEGNTLPVYDRQQDIYNEILSELEEATAALDASQPQVLEVLYGGDVAKWKSFGYSLMLRAAMRLSKVDPALAQEYVTKAVAGGLIQSNEGNAMIRHTVLYTNPSGSWLNGSEANNYFLTANFVDYLQENNDPRLASIAVRYVGAQSGSDQTSASATVDPSVQVGMPVGYDNSTIEPIWKDAGLASFYDYSQMDRTRMGAQTAPVFLLTHGQTQLLLAEAAFRGWTAGDPAEFFANGIRGHMEELAAYGDDTSVPEEEIAAYLQANPLQTGQELEQINTQYWVATFMNAPETFANFRRSGFPDLAPNPYPGSEIDGDFIRRLTYPDAEDAVNSANVNEAVSRQGPDLLDTRIWWDVE